MKLNKYEVYASVAGGATLHVALVASSERAVRARLFPWLAAGGFDRTYVRVLKTRRTHRTEDLFRKLYPVLEGTS